MDQKVVMYDSPEAATYKTGIEGWVNAQGQFWGKDEHMARWSGCTHQKCACGNIIERGHIRCRSCQGTEDMKRFEALEEVEWDETTPVCVFGDDTYFFDVGSLLDYLADQKDEAAKCGEEPVVRICLCRPQHLHLVSTDNWCDDLPEDGELPDEVAKKVDELNEAICAAGPVSWFEDKKRINLASYWAQIERGGE